MQTTCLSIVIPLFNEEDNILPLYEELIYELGQLKHFNTYEFLYINDGSTDKSLKILTDLAARDFRVKIISFMRNFGHESATYAGIIHATGNAAVLIDADQQDPPSLIRSFEQAYLEGYDIVYGQRTKRLNESWLKKTTSKLFYPVFRFLTHVDMPLDVGDFCLLSQKALFCFRQFSERAVFVRGLIYWSGLPKKGVPFIRRSRAAGITKYNYSRLTIFGLENIISFSTAPIYLMLFVSLIIIVICIIGSCVALCLHLTGRVVMTGWTSIIICLLFSFASLTFCLGILGLYIGKIFQEVKVRPLYLIDQVINMVLKKQNNINNQTCFQSFCIGKQNDKNINA